MALRRLKALYFQKKQCLSSYAQQTQEGVTLTVKVTALTPTAKQ
jgi:hypothetical protein